MAAQGGSVISLLDHAILRDPNGKLPRTVNMLATNDEFIQRFPFKESNDTDSHMTNRLTSEPTVSFKAYNEGAAQSKATWENVTDAMGMMQVYSEIDKDLADRDGNPVEFRRAAEAPFLQSLRKKAMTTLFYGDHSSDPKAFDGLATRYSNLTTGLYDNSMISAGGSGSDNTSIWLLNCGEGGIHGVFPRGDKMGIDMEDKGVATIETSATVGGARMDVYRTKWTWKLGLVVANWQHAVRLCNLDVSALVANSSPYDLISNVARMFDRVPGFTGFSPMLVCNSTVLSWFRVQALAKSNSAVTAETALNQFGSPQTTYRFDGVPIIRCDQIVNTESTVAA
jgi:hypothetical protein